MDVTLLAVSSKIRRLLGLRIAELRDSAGLTQEALALDIGVSKNTVQRLEAGKHWPEWDTLQVVADRLNISVDDLFVGLSEAPRSQSSDIVADSVASALSQVFSDPAFQKQLAVIIRPFLAEKR
jgi:transcriptional regulator with XRE-family HTH domain